MNQKMRSARVAVAILELAVVIVGCAVGAAAADRIEISSLDELPRHGYAVEGTASALLASDEGFAGFAAELREDIEGILAAYEIDDASTVQRLERVLMRLDYLDGRWTSVLERVERIRELEAKESSRLLSGHLERAAIEARSEVGEDAPPARYEAAFSQRLEAAVAALPWEVVQEDVERAKGRAEIYTENLLLGMAATEIDPVLAKTGEISSELAEDLVALRFNLEVVIPHKEQMIAVYQGLIDAHRVSKPDIWAGRAVELESDRELEPVVVAIWDSGVDTTVFEGSMWTNAAEKLDGTDTDGNGFVDDLYGIAYDVEGRASPHLLFPKGDMAGRVDQALGYTKGLMDLQASVDSDEASELRGYLGSLEPAQVKDFLESLGFAALYMHGTHVAGIAVEGNPFARILVARISFDYHVPPQVLTAEIARRHARSYRDTVAYFQANGVRAVNMSWGWTLKEVESNLESNGVGSGAEKRAELTREIFGILRDGLYEAIASAPDILFVTAAGNDDNDVDFDAVIPSSFELPNLITVAAVDQAGDPTSFTSSGRNVVIYTNGFEVESYVPGGERMAASGTSMASPNAVNLVAKLFALRADLTPAEVLSLMKEGAEPRDGDREMLLIHPKRSIELLEARGRSRGEQSRQASARIGG